MKIFAFLFCNFFLVCSLFSEEKQSKYRLDVYLQPNINYGYFTKPENYKSPDEFYKIGLDGGVLVNYTLTDRINIGTGLTYLKRGFEIKPIESDPLIPGEFTIKYNYNYFSIPFKFGYTFFRNSQFEASPIIGLSLDYLVNGHYRTIRDGKEMYSENFKISEGIDRFCISAFIGIDVLLNLKNKYALYLSPNFNFMMMNLEKDAKSSGFKTRFWNIGSKIGLRKSF